MSTKFTVTDVRKLTGNKVENGVLIFVEGQERAIFRSPSQMIIDLQNSFRLPTNITDWANQTFDMAIQRLIGKTVVGDVRFFEAGEEYEIEEGHPALTDKNHKLYGKVKVGSKQKAEKGGSYVTGFLSIPKEEQELNQEQLFANVANIISQSFIGLAGIATGGMAPAQPAPLAVGMPETVPAELP